MDAAGVDKASSSGGGGRGSSAISSSSVVSGGGGGGGGSSGLGLRDALGSGGRERLEEELLFVSGGTGSTVCGGSGAGGFLKKKDFGEDFFRGLSELNISV